MQWGIVIGVISHKTELKTCIKRRNVDIPIYEAFVLGSSGVSIIWRICELIVIRCNKMQACSDGESSEMAHDTASRLWVAATCLSINLSLQSIPSIKIKTQMPVDVECLTRCKAITFQFYRSSYPHLHLYGTQYILLPYY